MRPDFGYCPYPAGYVESYYDLAKQKQPKQCLEIGLEGGNTAIALLLASPEAKLISIDCDPSVPGPEMVEARIPDHATRFFPMLGLSQDILPTLGDTFDWIYIDGDHHEQAVTTDLTLTWPLLAKGGTLVLDDYGQPEHEVKQALDKFAKKKKLKIQKIKGHPHGGVYIERRKP